MAAPTVLDQLKALLTDIQKGKGDPKFAAADALLLVASLAKEMRGPRRGDAEVEYVVEDAPNGMVLTEHRKGGRAYPFRCPKTVYDAIADVLAANERALPLDELITEATEKLGDAPPDFQVRVALRLWMHAKPPLIIRNRARYRAVDVSTFIDTANELWMSLGK